MIEYILILLAAFAIVTLGLASSILVFRRLWTSQSASRSLAQNATLSAFTLLYFILLLEIFFRVGVAQSDSLGFTLAAKQWFKRYWKPVNSYGYRDIEYDENVMRSTRLIIVLGDSFTAGQGIDDAEDRFSNVLARRLGTGWSVVNMAKNGWTTTDQLNALQLFPYKPEIVVLAYVFNDITGAAEQIGSQHRFYVYISSPWLRKATETSYLLNFIYWRFYWRIYRAPGELMAYDQYVSSGFENERVWQIHKDELLKIADFTQRVNARLMVVVFPGLNDPARSRRVLSPAVDLLEASGAEIIDMTDMLQGREIDEIVVNSFDYHPNEVVHKSVGELIFERIQASDIP